MSRIGRGARSAASSRSDAGGPVKMSASASTTRTNRRWLPSARGGTSGGPVERRAPTEVVRSSEEPQRLRLRCGDADVFVEPALGGSGASDGGSGARVSEPAGEAFRIASTGGRCGRAVLGSRGTVAMRASGHVQLRVRAARSTRLSRRMTASTAASRGRLESREPALAGNIGRGALGGSVAGTVFTPTTCRRRPDARRRRRAPRRRRRPARTRAVRSSAAGRRR